MSSRFAFFAWIAALWLGCSARAWADSPPGQSPLPAVCEPDYRALVERAAAVWQSPEYADANRLIQRGYLRRVAEMAGTLARLWQWTGSAEHAREARRRLEAVLDAWEAQRRPGKPWKQVCFFSVYPIMDAYRILEAGGQLDAAWQARFRAFVREGYFSLERGAFNQALARAAGLALAARHFPDLPEAAAWRAYAGDVWNDWYTCRDTTENAAVYNAICMTFLFLLADALDRTAELDDPAVRRMFERFRNQVAPSGAMPQYGDSGDYPWGLFHGWGNWVAAFERAGGVWRDPTYRWAALRMFHAAAAHRPMDQRSYAMDSVNMVYALALADSWRDRRLRPETPRVASAVLLRREPGSRIALDKLVLAPSREPGAPFVMAELFSRWHHAHDNQWGSILHYEIDGAVLLSGLGYHNRAPEHANLVLMCPAGEPFPHRVPLVPPGVWQEASLPARRLPPEPPGASESDLRRIERVTFRVSAPAPVELLVDHLRLCGPAGEKVLDDFEQPGPWRGGQRQLALDATQGRHAMQVACEPGVSFVWRAGLDATFSLRDYDRIKFSWKMSGADGGFSESLVFRVDSSLSDYHVPIRQLAAVTEDAHAETRLGDHFGTIRLGQWFTDDSRLTRRLVLLKEGPLVVCDDLEPGPTADGQVAGPLWHLPAEPRADGHWFDAPGKRHLLVWLAPGPGRAFGTQTVELWGRVRPHTVFAKQPLRAGRPVRFVTVLLPHLPQQPAAELASRIALDDSQGASGPSIVRLDVSGTVVEIRVGPDGAVSVARR